MQRPVMSLFRDWVIILVLLALLACPSSSARDKRVQLNNDANRPLGLGPTDPWLEHLSWKPRAWLYHNFLTAEEADHLVDLAAPSMERSSVVDPETGKGMLDPVRTSSGTFLSRYQDAVVRDVEDRLAHWTHLPVSFGEDLQVLKYEPGQKYEEHLDWFDMEEVKKMDPNDETNRVATVLIYLSDVEEGGETSFSRSVWLNETLQRHAQPSECARNKLFVKPSKGDALLFWDLQPDGQSGDDWSMHAGCPVIKGEKWSATKWLHNGEYGDSRNMQEYAKRRDEFKCEDRDAACAKWADRGDCISNAAVMVGESETEGKCMAACHACAACSSGDLLCQRRSQRLKKQAVLAGKQGKVSSA